MKICHQELPKIASPVTLKSRQKGLAEMVPGQVYAMSCLWLIIKMSIHLTSVTWSLSLAHTLPIQSGSFVEERNWEIGGKLRQVLATGGKCDQIGLFLKILAPFFCKSSSNVW